MREDQSKKQTKALKEQGKQFVESNQKDFNIDGDSIPFDEHRMNWIFNELIEERSSEYKDLEKRINPDNLIYKYKK